MTSTKDKIWFSIAVVFAVCLTIFTLSHIVTDPAHVLPAVTGDAAKNNFTYLYQCVYGNGFWFEGMNYPYGEHVTYSDGQPLLSVFFASIHNVNVSEALATLFLLIGLSYVLCIVYNYKILIHFKIVPPVAIIFASLICFFSPQVLRIAGHYGLSYICVVPMLFYWTIKYHEQQRWRYCVYIFVLGCMASFLHPYFVGMILLWVLSYVIGYFIFIRGNIRYKIRHILPISITIISIVGFVAAVMAITDPVKDRPVIPYGVLIYLTGTKDIVTSTYSPVWGYVKDRNLLGKLTSHISDGGEGYTYIGIVTILAVIFSFATGVINKFKKNKADIGRVTEEFSPVWLFMAFSVLLFSMGVPYIWHMEWLLNYFSFVRQFRTLGRFSWIFYYIISVYGAVVVYTVYARLIARRNFFIGYAVLLLCISLWSWEASAYMKHVRDIAEKAPANYDFFFSPQEQVWEPYLKEHHFTKTDFQAILVLDFFDIGSEKLWVSFPGERMDISSKAAFQLHLPIVDVMMSRTSLSQTERQVKIIAGPYVDKPILHDMKSHKPFLMLVYEADSLNPDQKYLLGATDYIGDFSRCHIYACYPDRLSAIYKKDTDSINHLLPYMSVADTCIINKGEWYINHLDGSHAENRLFGNGAMPCIAGTDSNIAMIPVKPLKDCQEYEFSCWFLLTDKDYTSPIVFLESLDSSGQVIATNEMNTKESVDNYNLWFRGSTYFCMKANCRTVRCRMSNIPNPCYKVMDEIMLRPADALIISKATDGSVMVNNHLFKKSGR